MKTTLEPELTARGASRVAGEDEARFSYVDGILELILPRCAAGGRKGERPREGEAEFALIEEGPLLLLGYRFGQAEPWSFATFDWPAGPERQRVLPSPADGCESRALLTVWQARGPDAKAQVVRNLTLSLDFTRLLNEAIRERSRSKLDPAQRRRALAGLRRRFPTPGALLARAVVRSIGNQ